MRVCTRNAPLWSYLPLEITEFFVPLASIPGTGFAFLSEHRAAPMAPAEETTGVTQEIRELIDRILSSYDEIDARFGRG